MGLGFKSEAKMHGVMDKIFGKAFKIGVRRAIRQRCVCLMCMGENLQTSMIAFRICLRNITIS